ncbi:MAG TPA: EDSAP-1 family PEP-CTERM protein [Pseudoduganella sp.]
MKTSKLKLAALASAILMSAATGSAHAGAYALSSNNIQNFTITQSPGNLITFGASTDTSGATAALNGVNAGGPGVPGTSDAPIAALGTPVVTNNGQFTATGINPVGVTATSYSYADALITHVTPNVFNAQTIAESNLASTGTAGGSSTNSSATGFVANIVVNQPGGMIDFAFTADPLIRTFLQPESGKIAQGTLSASLTISCAAASGCGTDARGNAIGLGAVVFAWAPDGVADGASGVTGRIGGNELADAENLNLSVTNDVIFTGGGSLNFSDTGVSLGVFHAVTNAMNVGTYTLTLAMTSTDATTNVVPEPGTIGLLGLGLDGVALSTRRRKA